MLSLKAIKIDIFRDKNIFERGLSKLPPSFSSRVLLEKSALRQRERLSALLLLRQMLLESLLFNSENIRNAVICESDDGKPYLDGFLNVDFSISHTEGIAVCAFCKSEGGVLSPNGTPTVAKIGVDIEKIDLPMRYERIADRFFTAAEARGLCEGEKKSEEFMRIWTRKESLLKLRGEGISRLKYADTISAQASGVVSFAEYFLSFDDKRYIVSFAYLKKSGEKPPKIEIIENLTDII